MQKDVWLTISGTQTAIGEQPQTIELTTAGFLHMGEDGIEVSYVESELTGMAGVVTTFVLRPGRVVLRRQGAVNSQMVFAVGEVDKSLYDTGYGALLMEVRAHRVEVAMDDSGGYFDLDYTVDIEQTAAVRIDYHIEVKKSA